MTKTWERAVSRKDLFRLFVAETKELVTQVAREKFQSHLVRPPGALPEPTFLATCIRCGQCIKSCPQEILSPAAIAEGAAMGTPVVNFVSKPCKICGKCAVNCSTGALTVGEKGGLGVAQIKVSLCLAAQGNICQMCSLNCPQGAISVAEHLMPKVNEKSCRGCGTCQHFCPVEGAIRVTSRTN